MKKIILLLALCFTANNFFAQTTDPNQLKNEGNDALNAKNYAVAFEKYSEYLKLTNNQDSVTAYNCGVCADIDDQRSLDRIKTDELDAFRIAIYCEQNHKKIKNLFR